jgi:hypothetical protein
MRHCIHQYHSWRRIKVDFLKHFHNPRLDLLIWILVEKLAPTYQPKLDALQSNGRYRHRPAWRKAMKSDFRRCARVKLGCDPEDSLYVTDPHLWTCTCPHLATSRFLVCKHLVQACEPIPARFFLVVPARNRQAPFWRHPLLVPKGGHRIPFDEDTFRRPDPTTILEDSDNDSDSPDDDNDDDDMAPRVRELALPFDEAYLQTRHDLLWLLAALDHNAMFRDMRFIDLVRARCMSAFSLVNQLRDLQARTDSGRAELQPTTWGRNGAVRFLGFRTLTRERARELQHNRTTEMQEAGLAWYVLPFHCLLSGLNIFRPSRYLLDLSCTMFNSMTTSRSPIPTHTTLPPSLFHHNPGDASDTALPRWCRAPGLCSRGLRSLVDLSAFKLTQDKCFSNSRRSFRRYRRTSSPRSCLIGISRTHQPRPKMYARSLQLYYYFPICS